jgi:hypothetical protein
MDSVVIKRLLAISIYFLVQQLATYNKKGLLSSETIAPYTNKSLTTTYEYDRFGNKTKRFVFV